MKRKRSLMVGMTDYTGVAFTEIVSHIRDWRDETSRCIETLAGVRTKVVADRDRLDGPDDIIAYINHFVDLFGRYLCDFDRLLEELPIGVIDAHLEIVEQIYTSSKFEDTLCARFTQDHIDRRMKDERLRSLVDEIYSESRSMLADYRDLSNLVPRLRTFVGTSLMPERELEQKFGILYSAAQVRIDFDTWTSEAKAIQCYSVAAIFIDLDDFKRLNTEFTESVVDRSILGPMQQLLTDSCLHRGAAYRHGGEEFVILLPNQGIGEASSFAENLRGHVEVQEFQVGGQTISLTISAGVAVWPLHGEGIEQVIEEANRAERQAKEAGKNQVRTAARPRC